MIYFTQLIYLQQGQEAIFNQFEAIAIPAIAKYNGCMLLRIRPGNEAFIEHAIDKPYEIHLASFETEQDFINYSNDADRRQFLHLKEQSIQSSILIKGARL